MVTMLVKNKSRTQQTEVQNTTIKDGASKQKIHLSFAITTQTESKQRAANLAVFPTMEQNSNRADIKGIICKHLERPLIQFEKYFSESDNCFCDTKWIQFPFG